MYLLAGQERPQAWPGVDWDGCISEFLCTGVIVKPRCWDRGGNLASCLSEVPNCPFVITLSQLLPRWVLEAFCKCSELGGRRGNGREGRTRVGRERIRLLKGQKHVQIVREK